jgi:hypothetical protein
MDQSVRQPFQGISNIVRFNWHYYVLAVALIFSLGIITPFLGYVYILPMSMLMAAITIGTAISLFVSYYIYDASDLYSLNWLHKLSIDNNSVFVNINAGFDETSAIIASKYPANKLLVFDFYNPAQHTEVSIERARKAYPPFTGTQTITTTNIPVADGSVDYIFLIMAAHEIRDKQERIAFFKQLNKKLTSTGRVVVVEHQRDLPNFLAFNFGFFHFYSTASWKNTFDKSGFKIEDKFKQTPFISTYILAKNGSSS